MSIQDTIVEAFRTITPLLSSTLDVDEVIGRTLEAATAAVGAEGGSILLHDEGKKTLTFRHVHGGGGKELLEFSIPDSEGVAGSVFQSGEPSICNNTADDPSHSRTVDEQFGFRTRSMITLPLCYPGGRVVGVMQLLNKKIGLFEQADQDALGIVAGVAAMCILNADLAAQAQRVAVLTSLGELAHDVKNKMSPIIMGALTLETLIEDVQAKPEAVGGDGLLEDIRMALEAVCSGAREVERYSRFIADAAKGRPMEPQMEPGDLADVVRRQTAILEPLARAAGVQLLFEGSVERQVTFDRLLVERAVYNLVNNAIPETPEGGRIIVSVRRDAGAAVIEVSDSGRGMPPHVLESILSGNAVSTKPGGTGLGTSIVKKMAEAQGGRFEGESSEGKGSRLRIILPV